MDMLRCIVFIFSVSSLSVANKYCKTCDIKWFANACEMYCCMYEKVCDNANKYSTFILDQCKCSAPKITHPYCLMAERGNLLLKHSMCNLLKQYPSAECLLCNDLPEVPVTPKPTAFVYPTLPPGASTKKPVSEYCRFKEYCYFYAACDCRIHEPSKESATTSSSDTSAASETSATTPSTSTTEISETSATTSSTTTSETSATTSSTSTTWVSETSVESNTQTGATGNGSA